MSEFTDEKDDILGMIPGEGSDDDFDMSDSFFDDLEHSSNANTPMLNISEHTITNPLDLSTVISTDVVVMLETPATMTYNVGDGKEKLLPDEFMAWVKGQDIADGLVHDRFARLYETSDPGEISHHIPEEVNSTEWALYLPLLHKINAYSALCFQRGSVTPELLAIEHIAHTGMMKNRVESVNNAVRMLVAKVSADLEPADVVPSKSKRGNPEYVSEPGEAELVAQALVDLVLVFDGRSPLTLSLSSEIHGKLLEVSDHPVFNDEWRVGCLYNLYTSNNFPPYMAFRCAIAIGISKMDTNPALSCRFFFEGQHVLLRMMPTLRNNIFVRNAFFAFGEAMDSSGKYYYCAMLHDKVWPIATADKKLVSKAAKIAQKNKDYCRAVFYYLHALKIFRKNHSTEETIYTAQIVASIYKENDQINEGIQLLNSVLMHAYDLDVTNDLASGKEYHEPGKRKPSLSKTKSNRRAKSFRVFPVLKDEEPKPDAISTIMSAIFLCKLLIKARRFSEATKLMEHVLEAVSIPSITKILTFMDAKIMYHRNSFVDFVECLKSAKIFGSGMIPRVRHTSPVMMVDVAFSALKLLTKGYLERDCYTKAFFWSEILCHYATSQLAMKHMSVGFNLRGLVLASIYKNWNLWPDNSNLASERDELQESAGGFVSQLRDFTKDTVLCEALSSFMESRLASDRVGNGYHVLQSYLQYAMLLALHTTVTRTWRVLHEHRNTKI